jgi:pimeloyl-ACP methyl ester carboxylesterase
LTLERCTIDGNIEAECGYLHVPEDRNNPNGRFLDLKIVVVRAYGTGRQPDPLFYITGGPGGVATTLVNSVNTIFDEVNARRDIVFMDQRGTNDKHRLTCEFPDFSIRDASQQQVNDWMKKCLASLDGDPRFYTTVPAMQDLDDARAALGYDKINLYGGSYGTKAVQVYMRMFPEHVRAAVADHGNALDLPLYPTFPRAAQSALDQLFTYCEQDERCHAAYPDIRGDWKAVLARFDKGPVPTSYIPPGETEPFNQTKVGLEAGVYQLMYEGNYGRIPFLIHTLATNEDWTQIVRSYNEQHPGSAKAEPLLFMHEMIHCFDPAEAFGTGAIAQVDTSSYYYDAFMYEAQYWQKICAALPKPDPSLIYDPGRPAPVSMLMLNSRLDPIFPPSSMDLALKEFTKSRVVVEPTEGHYTSNSYCRWHMIAQYIEQGSVDGLDTSCLEQIKPYFVIGD